MYKAFIVDDDPAIVRGLKKIINWEEYGLDIPETAYNGLEAWKLIETNIPDIIITDVKMPRIGGLELIRKVKQIKSNTHFIVLSGYDDFEYLKESIKLGIDNYILKPIDVEELKSTIVDIVEKLQDDRVKYIDFDGKNITDNVDKQENMHPIIKRVMNYIKMNYTKNISLKCLAQDYNINQNYLGRLFKEEIGEYFTDYLNKIRVEKAKRLLLNTNKTARDISKEVGYNDPNYFYGLFKKYTGISPSEFKRQ